MNTVKLNRDLQTAKRQCAIAERDARMFKYLFVLITVFGFVMFTVQTVIK